MSDHKFTADRSDMAHRIKTLNGKAFDPAPIPKEMISNPKVKIEEKPRGA